MPSISRYNEAVLSRSAQPPQQQQQQKQQQQQQLQQQQQQQQPPQHVEARHSLQRITAPSNFTFPPPLLSVTDLPPDPATTEPELEAATEAVTRQQEELHIIYPETFLSTQQLEGEQITYSKLTSLQ